MKYFDSQRIGKDSYVYLKTIEIAWKNLSKNKFRSFLTSLGIIIGSATIVLVIEMGAGAKAEIEKQYSNMSVTTILVNAPAPAEGGAASRLAVPQLTGKVQSQSKENIYQAGILGSTTKLYDLADIELVSGRFFSKEEEDNHIKVAVLGATVAEELFGTANPDVIGQEITIGKKQFEIIGISKYKGGSLGPISLDDSIIMPYDSSYRYVLGVNGKFNLNLEAKDVESVDGAVSDVSRILRESHSLQIGSPEDFRVRDMGTNVQAAKDSAQTMALLLGSVGLVVLLVGGIGIMNVMSIVVKERTKEIGIRKAIGAKKNYILFHFLTEAVILSIFSSFIGLILASALYYLLKKYGLDIIFVWWSYGLSAMFTIGIGIFFGYYPALKAAGLKPVDTIRYE
ncbi:MAG: Macrolide export ATP-binding/permease protein MacB [Candidatus Moranbacteria bacterium GW2011_GWC2_37_73]|nr:MAG: Macrolide export ATP-binding/permease protein MacB [Candidatus Moranbacteria bacterium GW2011_GWC2_37_73]